MDFQTDFIEPTTPALTYNSINRYSKNEDSGYHTSYTPGSFQYSDLSNDSLNSHVMQRQFCQIQVDCYDITPEVKLRFGQRLSKCSSSLNAYDQKDSPISRRAVKRSYQEDVENIEELSSIPTPTSLIAGCLRKLKFSDGTKINKNIVSTRYTNTVLQDFNYQHDIGGSEISYPTTPVKKICRSRCTLRSPLSLRKPVKKLITHSLSCEIEALQPVQNKKALECIKSYHFKPNKKVDIIQMLYEHAAMPPIMEIFKYLSNEDIFNFSLVSNVWLKVWDDVSKKLTVKQNFVKFMQKEKENQENKGTTPKDNSHTHIRRPMGVHNIANSNTMKNTVCSPTRSPRTNRFKKFTKVNIILHFNH